MSELNKESADQEGGDERAAKPGLFCRDCGSRLMVRGVCSIYCPNCVKAQARAALEQPSPDAPYADDIAADLERSDWTPEDALRWYAAGKHFDTTNGRTRIIDTGAVASNALKHLSLPYLEMKGDAELTELREAMAQPSPAQAEAERPELWAVHAQGPDEMYAAFTREDAEKHAAELNALPMPEGIAVGAVVVSSPWPAAEHWQYLAEQERDHKSEITGALRAEIDRWKAEYEVQRQGKIKLLDANARVVEDRRRAQQERDAALARVAELEAKLSDPTAVHQWQFSNAWFDCSEEALLKAGKEGSPFRTLYAGPVAQAQHSVPMAPELKRALGLAVAALEADGDRPTSKYALSELKKVLAAAPGKEGV
ncbi:hypothetical protein ACTLPN_000303 [Pseudomonas aeruginosa]